MVKGPLCCLNDILTTVILVVACGAGILVTIVIVRFTAITAYNASDPAHFWHSSAMSDFDNTDYWMQSIFLTIIIWGLLFVGTCVVYACSAGTSCTGSCLWCLTKHGYNRYMADDSGGGDPWDVREHGSRASAIDPYANGVDLPDMALKGDSNSYAMNPMDGYGVGASRAGQIDPYAV